MSATYRIAFVLFVLAARGRADVTAWVDAANRCCFIDASSLKAERYAVTFPDGSTFTNAAPVFRRRLDGARPFDVRVRPLPDGPERVVAVRPHAKPLAAPLAPGEVLVGNCVYDNAIEFRDEIITNNLCNLLVAWSQGAPYTNFPPALRTAAQANGLHFMTIYGWDGRPVNESLQSFYGSRYLGNNIGEFAGYLYQSLREARLSKIPQRGDLNEVRNRFINEFIRPQVATRHRDYDFIFSTSGSPLGTYELQGGMDFMCCELYAVGAHNLAYATSEMRGAARKWKPEFWGGWLAEEWQTFPVPYSAAQKFDLLKASLYQQYLMGTSIIVLESGAQSTQAQDYTAQTKKRKQGYQDPAPTAYRRTVKEFYDWVRSHPREPSSPETTMAFVLGNNDGYVGMCHPMFAVWGQHETAATNANWKYAVPEATWETVQETFFPIRSDALAPYPNNWLAGSPYGQADIINMDDESRPEDLTRYAFIAYAGWNTMTPAILKTLARYVERGGHLFICLPHFSTRADREFAAYTAADLIQGGDLRPLMDARVTARAGEFARLEMGRDCRVTRRTAAGEPLVIESPRGKGSVRLLAAWPYPGKGTKLAKIYAEELTALAAARPQSVTISGTDAAYCSYAVYGKTVYLLNVDCVHPRSIRLRNGSVETTHTFNPAEFKIIHVR